MSSGFLVDPDPLFCAALAHALTGEGLRVVGWTTDEEDAMALVRAKAPDLVLTEVALSGGSGLSLARKLRADVPTIVLTRRDEGDVILDAVVAGAMGCLGHRSNVATVASLVRGGLSDGFVVDPLRLRSVLARAAAREREPDPRGVGRMTPREREVFRMIGFGLGNEAIAAALYVSPETVRTHVGRILRKLGVHSRAEAARIAVRSGETASGDVTPIVGPDLGR